MFIVGRILLKPQEPNLIISPSRARRCMTWHFTKVRYTPPLRKSTTKFASFCLSLSRPLSSNQSKFYNPTYLNLHSRLRLRRQKRKLKTTSPDASRVPRVISLALFLSCSSRAHSSHPLILRRRRRRGWRCRDVLGGSAISFFLSLSLSPSGSPPTSGGLR